jgi:diphosphomevalonate decarboxylase
VSKATAVACSNIAFVKYWGKRDEALRLPMNSSLSMAMSHATTTTTVAFVSQRDEDQVFIGGEPAAEPSRLRVIAHLDRIRRMSGIAERAEVASQNDFPANAGIASSASGFAALTAAGTRAAGLELSAQELSCLARLGSGSAARSILGGFSEWHAGQGHESSYAEQLAPPQHWPELRDIVVVLEDATKPVSSTQGMALASTSPHFSTRMDLIANRLACARQAILDRDLAALGEISEREAIELHLIAMTSRPPIFYWQPATLALIHHVLAWRAQGLEVYFTIDAGPNVHLLCEEQSVQSIVAALEATSEAQRLIVNAPGFGTRLCAEHLF